MIYVHLSPILTKVLIYITEITFYSKSTTFMFEDFPFLFKKKKKKFVWLTFWTINHVYLVT